MLLALCAMGCGRASSVPAETRFMEGARAYVEGRFAEAARCFAEAGRAYGRSERGAEAVCWEGLSRLGAGQLRQAEERLRCAYESGRNRGLQARSLQGLARVAEKEARPEAAERLYLRLRRSFADEIDRGQILKALIRCCRNARHNAGPYVRELEQVDAAGQAASSGAAFAAAAHAVQAGVFGDSTAARALCQRLGRSGFTALVRQRQDGDRALYVVQVGVFSTREAAQRQADALKARGFAAVVMTRETR